MARPKSTNEVMVSISTRIKHSTETRLDEYCNETGSIRSTVIDQAINDFLTKLEKRGIKNID